MKNDIHDLYEIRQARYDEIDEIMNFINKYWRENHILARDRAFFEYEMVDEEKNVNFVVARERTTGEIFGIDGFIFASSDKSKRDTWGSVWMVREDAKALLGLEIDKCLKSVTKTRKCLVIGGNPKTTIPLIKCFMKYKDVGKMQHFYCLAKKDNYLIAHVEHYEECKGINDYVTQIEEIKDIESLSAVYDFKNNEESIPYKDKWYVKHRYYDHPIYNYFVYGLKENEKVEAIMVCREQEYAGGVALRIVDYIGEQRTFRGLSSFFRANLEKYEYIDIYCYGFDNQYLLEAGMTEVTEDDTNIIPNYFAPFVLDNIDIWVGAPEKGAVFLKADGDQDRPN